MDSSSDNSNNYYFIGVVYCNGCSAFDGLNLGTQKDYFIILKYNSSGTRIWTNVVQSISSRGHGIISDTSGNSYSTGYEKKHFQLRISYWR